MNARKINFGFLSSIKRNAKTEIKINNGSETPRPAI
jgi:hypothetical protein